MGIGRRLKRLIQKKEMSLKELSALSGVPVNTLYTITQRDPDTARIETLEKISKALNCTIADLIVDHDFNETKIVFHDIGTVYYPWDDGESINTYFEHERTGEKSNEYIFRILYRSGYTLVSSKLDKNKKMRYHIFKKDNHIFKLSDIDLLQLNNSISNYLDFRMIDYSEIDFEKMKELINSLKQEE